MKNDLEKASIHAIKHHINYVFGPEDCESGARKAGKTANFRPETYGYAMVGGGEFHFPPAAFSGSADEGRA